MKIRKNRSKRVEILENIGPIPKGVYRLTGQDDLVMHFTIKNKVFFGITKDASDRMQPASKRASLTPVDEFIDRYYPLMEAQRNVPFRSDAPFTFCALDPGVAREVH